MSLILKHQIERINHYMTECGACSDKAAPCEGVLCGCKCHEEGKSRGHIPELAFKNGKAYCKICEEPLE